MSRVAVTSLIGLALGWGQGAFGEDEVLTSGSCVIPISKDEIHVYEFSTQKIHVLERKDYPSQQALMEAVGKLGDLFIDPPRENPNGYARSEYVRVFKACQFFFPVYKNQFIEDFQGSDLSALAMSQNPLNAKQGSLFALKVKDEKHVFIHVDKVDEKSVSLSWLYRSDGRCIFSQIPGEPVGTASVETKSVFERVAQLERWRMSWAPDLEEWCRNLDSPAYALLRKQAKDKGPFTWEGFLEVYGRPVAVYGEMERTREPSLVS